MCKGKERRKGREGKGEKRKKGREKKERKAGKWKEGAQRKEEKAGKRTYRKGEPSYCDRASCVYPRSVFDGGSRHFRPLRNTHVYTYLPTPDRGVSVMKFKMFS